MTTPSVGPTIVPSETGDIQGASSYLFDVIVRCRQGGAPCSFLLKDRAEILFVELWRFQPVEISEEKKVPWLSAFKTLAELAIGIDANLRQLFMVVGKDIFDELVNIVRSFPHLYAPRLMACFQIMLVESQKKKLLLSESQSLNTVLSVMSLDDIEILIRVLYVTKKVASLMVEAVGTQGDYYRDALNAAHAEMCASLEQWCSSRAISAIAQPTSVSVSPSSYVLPHPVKAASAAVCLPGPSRVPRRTKVPTRLHLQPRSTSLPIITPAYADSDMTSRSLSPSSATASSSGDSRSTPPRKRSLNMLTPDTPSFSCEQSAKRTRQSTTPCRWFSLVYSEITLVAEEVSLTTPSTVDARKRGKGKGKGKEVERWLQSIDDAYDVDEVNPQGKYRPLVYPLGVEGGYGSLSSGSASGSGTAALTEIIDSDKLANCSVRATPILDKEDVHSNFMGSSASDSSWHSTVRDYNCLPKGAFQIYSNPGPIITAYESVLRHGAIDIERNARTPVRDPLWLRLLRAIFPCF